MKEVKKTAIQESSETGIATLDNAGEVLDAFYVLDEMRLESRERRGEVEQVAAELLLEAGDEGDASVVRAMVAEDTRLIDHDLSGRLAYIRKKLGDVGFQVVQSAAELYVGSASNEEDMREAASRALAYRALLNQHMPFGVVGWLVLSAKTVIENGVSENTNRVIGRGEEKRVVDAVGEDVYTAVVPAMDGVYDPAEGAWTAYRRFTGQRSDDSDERSDYRGQPITVVDGNLKTSVVLDDNGIPKEVRYHRTTKEPLFATDHDEIDRIAKGSEAGAVAVNATGARLPNVMDGFREPKHGTYQGFAVLPVGKRS